jgi:gliding motility-associated lipoprotein GldH
MLIVSLYVFLYSEYPDGSSHKDTLEFLLAEPDGKWLGENTGTIVEFKGPIAAGGRFSKLGKYTFKLQHAMREEELKEVVDIGLCIEKFEVDPEETE